MQYVKGFTFVLLFSAAIPTSAQESKIDKDAGWFSDERCAPARLTTAKLGPGKPGAPPMHPQRRRAGVHQRDPRDLHR